VVPSGIAGPRKALSTWTYRWNGRLVCRGIDGDPLVRVPPLPNPP